MTEPERIAALAESVYHDGGWIEVSLRDLFQSLTAAEAAAHPIAGAHSAWEIALHLAAWHEAVRRRIGGEAVELSDAEDWPAPAAATETNWQAALKELEETYAALVNAIRILQAKKLDETVPGRPFSFYVMLHGVMQHDLYHSGQVMMLRKALRAAAS
ncbi:MAG TPA: DinB family protein [bacterium]|jgi:uncharacterized damage-inducible protein DinB